MKVAVIHDWLVTYAGAERVLEQILLLYPDADLFSVVDFFPQEERKHLLNKVAITTFIQKVPFAHTKYRQYLPLMPLAVEQFDLSSYDLIISSSHAVAKGVLCGPDQLHVSYVHTPIRYAWDLQHQYLKESGLSKGIKGLLAKLILHYMRLWDIRTANSVDLFMANSQFVARRIWKTYRREAVVVYPPVAVQEFPLEEQKEDFYLTASRMVPYKKIDLIVEAFANMPERRLIVVGDGPDYHKIRQKASANVTLLGYQSFSVLREYMQKAKAFIFASEEDFGITPVEAQACGTPVIAYGKGGALETICGLESDKPTGVFFYEQTVRGVQSGIEEFERNIDKIQCCNCRENALRFSQEAFRQRFQEMLQGISLDFFGGKR